MTAERPYKLFEGPNGTIPNLNLNQTYNLTLNRNFVVKTTKLRKNNALQYTKHRNCSHPQVSAHHTNKTISNSQTWHSPNTRLQKWSHKDDNHYENLQHFCSKITKSS